MSGVMDPRLRRTVLERDGRCRFCGRTGVHLDVHHIVYRRGVSDDRVDNLIAVCRGCHDRVHGLGRDGLGKSYAQDVLFRLLEEPGATGLALLRRDERVVDAS